MIKEFTNNLKIPYNRWQVANPYYYIRIDSIDNHLIITDDIKTWPANQEIHNIIDDWVGTNKADEITFTKSFKLPKTGLYLIEVFGWKQPQVKGMLTLQVQKETIQQENMYNDWSEYGTWIKAPILTLNEGDTEIDITVPKNAYVNYFKISPITRYEGRKNNTLPHAKRLDLIEVEFSKNGANEVDTGTIKIAFKEDYYDQNNPYSSLCFDAWDPITILLGEDMRTTIPMFGGYIMGWSLNDTQTELTLKIVDRLIDFKRTYTRGNYYVGNKGEDSNNNGRPEYTFSTVNELLRYLTATNYPINFNADMKDYALYYNFGEENSIQSFLTDNCTLKWEEGEGHPAPCMTIDTDTKEASLTIYSTDKSNGNVWTEEYNYFNFNYKTGGSPSFNIEFDIKINDKIQTYYIDFSQGKASPYGTEIAEITPTWNDAWQNFSVDLKALITKTGYNGSYIVEKVRFKGNIQKTSIDNLMAYKDYQTIPNYSNTEIKTILHALQDICEKANYVVYTRPAMERKDDELIVIPQRNHTLPIEIKEDENLLHVSNLQYYPLDWGMANDVIRTYTKETTTDKTTRTQVNVESKDNNAIAWYGSIRSWETLSEVKNETDAQTAANNHLKEHSWNYPSFDTVIQGSCLIEPGQYAKVTIPSKHLNNKYEIKSLNYKLDCIYNHYYTEINFSQPHREYMHFMRDTMKSLGRLKNFANLMTYYKQTI